jgi:outer membrane biosynthesis protein TonB
MPEHRTRTMERRYRRALRWGLVASFLVHAGLFLVFDDASLPTSPFSAAGERRGDPRAARGGGMEAVELRAPAAEREPEPAVEPPPEEVVEEADEPMPEPEVVEPGAFAAPLADVLSAPGPVSALRGPGLADGEGEGDGGTEAEGLFRVVPPRPRGLIQPPADRPERMRGREVEIWVYVSSAGRVVEDSTRLNPSTGDRRFDRRLRDSAADWVFEAARRDGRPVGEWFRYTIVM